MFAKNYHSHWIAGIVNILSKYTYFLILGVAFAVPFLCYFQKLQFLVVKKIKLIFDAVYYYIYQLKKCLSDFSNLISNWKN